MRTVYLVRHGQPDTGFPGQKVCLGRKDVPLTHEGEKQAERLDDRHYRILITYNEDDETEMLIRILAFGPVIRVKSPTDFVELMKERLLKQKSLQSGEFESFFP